MERSILVVEPDIQRGKRVARLLIRSGYDALMISCADKALRQLYQAQPDAVILSNRLPADDLERLSKSITMMSDLPVIELISDVSPATTRQRCTRSVRVQELLETLDELLESDLPTGQSE